MAATIMHDVAAAGTGGGVGVVMIGDEIGEMFHAIVVIGRGIAFHATGDVPEIDGTVRGIVGRRHATEGIDAIMQKARDTTRRNKSRDRKSDLQKAVPQRWHEEDPDLSIRLRPRSRARPANLSAKFTPKNSVKRSTK